MLSADAHSVANFKAAPNAMDGPVEKSELLSQLRIDRNATEPRSRAPLYGVIGVVLAVLIGGGLWWTLAGAKPVLVKTVAARSLAKSTPRGSVLDATGYVTARRQATVSAKVTGKVAEVLIEEGQRVEEGQILARLDQTDWQAQLDLAQAQLAAARSQISDWQVQLEQSERDLQRQQDMVGRKLISQQSVDQARAARDSLKSRLSTSQRQADVAVRAVQVANVNMDNTIIRAPFAGVIIAKAAQQGEIVSPMSAGGGFTRTGIGTVVDMDSLEIEVDVNESYIGRVKPDQPVDAMLNAYPDWKIPAYVIAIIPTADRSKATVKVRVGLKVKDPRIVPDMGARVAFLNDTQENEKPVAAPLGVLVPASAIRGQGDAAVVFVAADEKAQRRAVKVGSNYGDDRQILSGLRDGERVIIAPAETLKEGDRIALDTSN
jgi:RND family efflux transporter MFP subunit